MTIPLDNNSQEPKAIRILHAYTRMIRKEFCYSIDLTVVARRGHPRTSFSPRIASTPNQAIPRLDQSPAQAYQNDPADTVTAAGAGKRMAPQSPAERQTCGSNHRSRYTTSKGSKIIEMMKRAGGATLSEIRATS